MSRTKKLWVASMMVAAMVVQAVAFAGVAGASDLQLKATPGDLINFKGEMLRTINVTWNENLPHKYKSRHLRVTIDGITRSLKYYAANGRTSIRVPLKSKKIDIDFIVYDSSLSYFSRFKIIGSTSVVATP